MASRMNYRGGDTQEVLIATHPDHPYEKGDLLILDPATKTLWPVSDVPSQSTLAETQAYIRTNFAGVALEKQGLQPGEKTFNFVDMDRVGRVATAGQFEFDCDAQIVRTGIPFGAYVTATGMQNQKVATTTAENSIGIAAPGVGGAEGNMVTSVIIEIVSTVMQGGQ